MTAGLVMSIQFGRHRFPSRILLPHSSPGFHPSYTPATMTGVKEA